MYNYFCKQRPSSVAKKEKHFFLKNLRFFSEALYVYMYIYMQNEVMKTQYSFIEKGRRNAGLSTWYLIFKIWYMYKWKLINASRFPEYQHRFYCGNWTEYFKIVTKRPFRFSNWRRRWISMTRMFLVNYKNDPSTYHPKKSAPPRNNIT
jgi:hypothetical protein